MDEVLSVLLIFASGITDQIRIHTDELRKHPFIHGSYPDPIIPAQRDTMFRIREAVGCPLAFVLCIISHFKGSSRDLDHQERSIGNIYFKAVATSVH